MQLISNALYIYFVCCVCSLIRCCFDLAWYSFKTMFSGPWLKVVAPHWCKALTL